MKLYSSSFLIAISLLAASAQAQINLVGSVLKGHGVDQLTISNVHFGYEETPQWLELTWNETTQQFEISARGEHSGIAGTWNVSTTNCDSGERLDSTELTLEEPYYCSYGWGPCWTWTFNRENNHFEFFYARDTYTGTLVREGYMEGTWTSGCWVAEKVAQ